MLESRRSTLVGTRPRDYHAAAAESDMEVTLDGYRAQRLLRSSSTSQVWEVVRLADRELVIAKVFAIEDRARLEDVSPRLSNRARVDHEFDMIRRLEVPGVVRALALERTGDQLVILLEAHRGIDLGELLAHGPLPLADFLAFALQITRILADVHEQGVVHRDIKPTNILVDPDTREIVLADFGISELLASERGQIHDSAIIEGTLPYMSPEQTGRTAREVDFRSDLYSLGVTFYEALTGQRPFRGESPLELIHAHLARRPTPPQRLRPELPTLLSDLVMKLLEKAPERRYQSARGLWRDLHAIQSAQAGGGDATLELGRDDVPLTLQLPHQIHGRANELARLHAAFRRAISERPTLVVITGEAGVGKTMLCEDLVEPVLGQRGFLARGRFSEASDQPLAALIGALSALADQLLTLPPEQLEHWRERLLARLGPLAAVVGELIPGLRLVLGKLPSDEARTAAEVRNQVMLACVRLVTSFARPEHPLVLVFDDMQWADSATFELLDELLVEPQDEQPALLLVLSGRERATAPGTPLSSLLVELETRGRPPTRIELGPLERGPLIQLIAAMLSRPPAALDAFAEIVARKTSSNPFFVGQLLLHLAEQGLLQREREAWTWDLAALEAATLPEDVLDMMTRKLAGLAPELRRLLQVASVLGDNFDAESLQQASGSATAESRLLELVDEGLIAPLARGYVFGHDRIREAAHASLDPAERVRLHRSVGVRLSRELEGPALDQRVFEVVEHLDRGYQLDTDADEAPELERPALVELAQLNLRATARALASGAPHSAAKYLGVCQRVLARLGEFPGPKAPLRDLHVAAELAAAKIDVLLQRFEAADQRLEVLLARPLEVEEIGAAAELHIWTLHMAGRHEASVRVALRALRRLGIAIPAWPQQRHMLVALLELAFIGRPTTLARLSSMPPTREPRVIAALDILLSAGNSSYVASPTAFIVLTVAHARLLLRHGNHRSAPLVITQIGLLVAGAFDRQARATALAELARELAEREQGHMLLRVRQANCFNRMWVTPFADLYGELDDVFDRALEHGDRELAETAWVVRTMLGMFGGQHLRLVEALAESRVRWPESWNNHGAASVGEACRRLIAGPPPAAGDRDPLGVLAEPVPNADFPLSAHQHIISALVLAVFGRWPEVHALLEPICDPIERAMGRIWFISTARLLLGISAAALANHHQGHERAQLLATLRRSLQRVARWTARGANLACHEAFLRAELSACEGLLEPAIEQFERARELATQQRNPMLEALTSERLAAMLIERKRERLALGALLDARDRYQHWGAFAKVAQLEQRWPELGRRARTSDRAGASIARGTLSASSSSSGGTISTSSSSSSSSTSDSTTSKAIDSATLLKASQMLTEDIRLDDVVLRVMDIALENAGAQRGVLLLADKNQLRIAAEATTDEGSQSWLTQAKPLSQAGDQVASAIIRWVERTGEPVVLADASSDPRFSADPYLRERDGLSVLCLPFVKRGRLVGLLYLENQLSAGSFLPERLELLRLLTAQTASALENAQLYDDLRTSESRWRSLVEQLPDYVLLINRSGQIEYVNLSATAATNPHASFDPSTLAVGEHQQRVFAAMARVFGQGSREQFEIHAKTPAGDSRWYSVRIAPIAIDETIDRAIVVATDITDRKQAEIEREQLESQVRQQQRLESIGTLASGVAHEINNPIQGIMNYAELIAGAPGASEMIREFAGEIEVETERVTTIVRNLLAFSRQEHDESSEAVSVHEIVEGTLSLIRTVLRKDQISLQVEVPEDLPELGCRRQQIQQVIMNLVTNARDALNSRWPGYHADKLVSIRAATFERDASLWIRLSVEDRGGGVPLEVLPQIFDPFFTTKGRDRGTGLGLALSHGIVTEHGGKLIIDNQPGVGACFSIELPANSSPPA